MSRHTPNRLVRAATDAFWRRDQMQMRAASAVLNALTAKAAQPARVRVVKRKTVRRRQGFRSVLCAIDFSEPSRTALRHADAISGGKGASLTVLHVEDPLLVSAAAALHDRRMVARSSNELRKFVDETIVRGSAVRRRVTIRVVVGKPADEIVKAATRVRCDLIVIGTHGLSAIDRILVGSTAMGVLQRARVPVLAVPRGAR